ncbi:MAG: 5'-nucleotidase C-terminal domain-containing protein, partial [Gemmatimonadaceae bacterium]|nr:5'-nucleotidase C-terminal domain-containing protein [Gemmatimonadaceae bacterium]
LRYVPVLRARADVVVIVSHQGTLVDSLLAEQVPGIDVIIGGHSHDRVQPLRRVRNTWLAQALSDATALGEVRLQLVDGRVSSISGVVHELYADRVVAHPRYSAMLDSIRAAFADTLLAVVSVAAQRIGRQYKSESPVDRLAAELLRKSANAEVAFLPGLGFGVTLQPGPITREMLFGLFPHPSAVVHMQLTGAQIQAILEQSATNLRPLLAMDRVGGLIQSAGLRYTIDLTKPVGARVGRMSIGSTAIDPVRYYRVVTTSGLLQGTHRQSMFAHGVGIRRDSQQVTTVLEAGLRAQQRVHAPVMGDVTLVQ